MGLSATEETTDPNTDLARNLGVFGSVDGLQVGLEKLVNVKAQFLGHHELVQLLPDNGVIELLGFDDTIDGAVDVAGEEFADGHGWVLGIRGRA